MKAIAIYATNPTRAAIEIVKPAEVRREAKNSTTRIMSRMGGMTATPISHIRPSLLKDGAVSNKISSTNTRQAPPTNHNRRLPPVRKASRRQALDRTATEMAWTSSEVLLMALTYS